MGKNHTQKRHFMDKAIQTAPPIAALAAEMDVIDVKVFESTATLREFVAGMIGYYPGWLKFLYAVRMGFVRVLGMRQEGIPTMPHWTPEKVAMLPGQKAGFFNVEAAEEDHFWLAGIKDTHLDAYLGVIVEPLAGDVRKFHVVTLVKYNRWTGPVYFNVIRPFHHVVVYQMGKAGAESSV
jgi:hypothetical protein